MSNINRAGWMAVLALALTGAALPALAQGSEKGRDRDDDYGVQSEAPRAYYDDPRGYGQRWGRESTYREGYRDGYREGYRRAWREAYRQAMRDAERRYRYRDRDRDYWRNGWDGSRDGSLQPTAWRDGDWLYYRDNGQVLRIRIR